MLTAPYRQQFFDDDPGGDPPPPCPNENHTTVDVVSPKRDPAWLAERLVRASNKARADVLKQLGVVDAADLEAAQLAVAEARARRRSPEALAADLEEEQARNAQLLAENRKTKFAMELHGLVGPHGAMLLDARAFILAITDPRRADRLEPGEDGSVVVVRGGKPTKEKAVDAMEALLHQHNYLVRAEPEGEGHIPRAASGRNWGPRLTNSEMSEQAALRNAARRR